MCAWFVERGVAPARASWGGPIDCEPPALSGYAVYGATNRKFLFDEQNQLAVVLEEGRCVAGPRALRLHTCVDWLVGLGCMVDAGTE
jgi:hypothetical protein